MLRFLAVLLIAMTALPAAAQTPVDDVLVTTTDEPAPLRGTLTSLGAGTLTLLTESGRRDLPFDTVLRIDARKDRVLNGALIGAAVLGGWCALVCAQGLDSADQAGPFIVMSTVWGALIGAGIDAMHTGRTPIFRRPDPAAAAFAGPRLSVAKRLRF